MIKLGSVLSEYVSTRKSSSADSKSTKTSNAPQTSGTTPQKPGTAAQPSIQIRKKDKKKRK